MTDRCGTDIIDTRALRLPAASHQAAHHQSANAAASEQGVTDLLVFKMRFTLSEIRD
jgi:hypothetical protein